jgi:hypothetical protein
MEIWTNGDMETWLSGHGDMDMETRTWRHGHGDLGMKTWAWRHRHGNIDMETWNLKKSKTENGSPRDFPLSVYRLFIMQTDIF